MKGVFPREGGILTLWSSGTAIGLFFLVRSGAALTSLLYLAGSLLFLASVGTVKEFIRLWRGKRGARLRLLMPPLFGLTAWGYITYDRDAVAMFFLFLVILATAGTRVIGGREREWPTRVAFTGAVLAMALLGLFVSGGEFAALLAVFIFAVPFTFFSAQELFVQAIAEAQRLSGFGSVRLGFRKVARSRKASLYSFLGSYAIASGATALLTSSAVFPVVFELFLISFPVIWLTSGRRVSFRRLGFEQASLDALMTIAVIVFAAIY